MSSGASIPHLLRVHFVNVGHPDARLSPLTLNFFRDNELGQPEALDSVIWAENGVGKSSIRALLFSLLHPSIHDVMKSSNGPLDNRKYELFFGPHDSAFVISEWLLPAHEQPQLTGFPEEQNTLILGFAAHWPRNHQSTLSDLDRHFFMFRPRGSLTFDRLPIRGLSRGREPVAHAKDFMEWFKTQAKTVEGRHTTIHREWSQWLADAGLDPVIFAYQLRMNGGQGGILGLFKNRINSSTDFVHFFLETVLNQDVAEDVVEVLNEKKSHIEKKPQWEAEVAFVDEALPLLYLLQEQKVAHHKAETELIEDRDRAGALIAGLELSEQNLRHQTEEIRHKARDVEREVAEKQEKYLNIQEYRSWLRHHESTLELDQAENRMAASQKEQIAAAKELALLRAALEFVEWRAKLDECKAIEIELAGRSDSQGDVEAELAAAGDVLVAVLEREIERVASDLENAQASLSESRKSLIANQKEHNRTKSELGKIREVIRGVNASMQNREKVLRRLVHAQILKEDETPSNAVTRWKHYLKESGGAIEQAAAARLELDAEKKKLTGLQEDHVVRLTRSRGEFDQLQSLHDRDSVRMESLRANADLRRLTGEAQVHLANANLPDWIREKIVAIQQEIFGLSRTLADDRETLAAIEQSDSKLYPPPAEVAKLLAVLRDELQIPAHLAVEELDEKYATRPEEAERLLSADPARFMGIMAPSAEHLTKIRQRAATLHRPAYPVQVSVSGDAPNEPPDNAVVLRPGHRAAFNRQAAREMIQPLRAGITEKERLLSDHQNLVRRLQAVLEELLAFMENNPSGALKELEEKIKAKSTVIKDLEQIQITNRDRIEAIEQELRRQTELIKKADQTKQQSEHAVDRLRDFIEDHESAYRESRAKLMETRAQLHIHEDKGVRLEATLEEDQHLVSEKQESVFRYKSEIDRKKERLKTIAYRAEKPVDVGETTLAEAETTYNLCLDRFKQTNEKDETLRARLEEKRHMALERENRYRKTLGVHDEEEVQTSLADGRLEERIAAAEHTERSAAMAVGAAESALLSAREHLREAPTLSLDYQPPAEETLPKTAEAARRRRKELEDQLEEWRLAMDQLKDLASEHREKMRQRHEDITFRQLKREELLNHIPDHGESANLALPVGNDELKEVLDAFWLDFRAHKKSFSEARLAVENGCNKLKDLASAPRLQNFPNDKREILKLPESLLRQTDEIITEFTIFREVIQTSLRMSEESAEAIITRLDAHISDALHLITLSKSSSRLPDRMEGWGGLSFLKMDILGKAPEGLESRKPIYESVLRDALQSGKPLRGLDLIKRGLDALAGERGYRAEVMKPGYSLKTEYHPVTDVKGWSDGEKITSVILIYCAMVQLRAVSTGGHLSDPSQRRALSNGMLFLDNPFGEANSLTFVNMQLTMAHALNIQLVYTASGSHKHLMARFPRVIRLSQELGSKKTFVKASDVGQEIRASVNVTAAHFGRRRVG